MARRLQEDDAFTLAVDWGRRLARVADLELDASLSQRVPAFNRIRVRFEVGDVEMVTVPMTCDAWSVLRETFAVWRALTCCHGFSGAENPAFWDRVVSVLGLQLAVNEGPCLQLPPDDALEMSMCSAMQLTLCISVTAIDEARPPANVFTLEGGFANYAVSCKSDTRKTQRARDFVAAWYNIQPFFDESRTASLGPIELALELEAYRYNPCTVFLRSLPAVIETIVKTAQKNNSKSDKFTYLRLRELNFRDWRVASTDQMLDLASLLSLLPVRLSSLGTCVETIDGEDAYSRFSRSALGLKQIAAISGSPPWRPTPQTKTLSQSRTAKRLHLMYENLETRHVVALFSALPNTQCVEELQLGTDSSDNLLAFSGFLASWIGYAVFHPKSRTSSWRNLALLNWRGSDTASHRQLIQMAVNPLESLSTSRLATLSGAALNKQRRRKRGDLNGDDRDGEPDTVPFTTSKLLLARLKRGAEVRTSRRADAPVWITLQRELTLEVCKAIDRNGGVNASVCALVPGYGFGWVAKSAIASTTEWVIELPLSSPLRGLKCYCEEFPKQTTALLLHALGANLVSLSVVLDPLDPHILDVVAHACPNVQHLGAVSASSRDRISLASLTRTFSRSNSQLRSLGLNWDLRIVTVLMMLLGKHVSNTHAVLRLKKLHICAIESLSELRDATGAIEHMLKANKSLEQLVLTTRFDSINAETDAADEYARLRAFNREDLTHFTPLRQRLSFLSVVHARATQHPHSVYCRLDAALIVIIFAFAIPNLQRQVTIFREPRMT